MPAFTLLIGQKNNSTWSLRAWLALRQTGADFHEEVAPLNSLAGRFVVANRSPTRLVPVLIHGDFLVWDSLAIIEYLAELYQSKGLWPDLANERAQARSICAEMHSGFPAIRSAMPMDIQADAQEVSAEGVVHEIERICVIWRELLQKSERRGPYLFGSWSAADAYFAPVVSRFETYRVDLDNVCRSYADAVLAWPSFIEWRADAVNEASTE